MSQLLPQEISIDVLLEKYAKKDEKTIEDVFNRIATGISSVEKTVRLQKNWKQIFYDNLLNGGIGAGRIMSAGGANIDATLINCFVQNVGDAIQGTDKDGNIGIYEALRESAETMRRGGGVGYDFSKIRPKNAKVGNFGARASGPCSYMNIFNSSCSTIESAGARRGAQMGVLKWHHPDILDFIQAKRTPGTWNNFNISVYITDDFMKAKENDEDVQLFHKVAPSEELQAKGAFQREDGMWVYRTVKATWLWDIIMKSNYDYAEPGVLFGDTINNDNNLRYCEVLEATNPCVTSDTWVHTTNGPRQVKELIDNKFTAYINGQPIESDNGFFSTGTKPIYKLKTDEGFELKLTKNHKVLIDFSTKKQKAFAWVEAGDLQKGDRVVLHNQENTKWEGEGTYNEGYMLGVFIGDGHFSNNDPAAYVSAYKNSFPEGTMDSFLEATSELKKRCDHKGWQTIKIPDDKIKYVFKSAYLKKLADKFGLFPNKEITPIIEKASYEFYIGFIKGFFDTDGYVDTKNLVMRSIRLSQSNKERLEAIQRMLARLGIISNLLLNRRPDAYRMLPDQKGGLKEYFTKASHELTISKTNCEKYLKIIGFNDTGNLKRSSIMNSFFEEKFVTYFSSLEYIGEEEVYDVIVPGPNAFDGNGLYIHNCGEQPLPDYGCCDLGPIILTKFVKFPFTPKAIFDFESFKKVVAIQVRFLDNVLIATRWPLEQQKKDSDSKRRIGVGFTGLGNALAMLRMSYASSDAIKTGAKIAETMRDAAYMASIELAKERGAFPLFNADKYLEKGTFASRLPSKIKTAIRKYGIRNSHLLSIAPTGTVSLAFADNASNGIEPPFSLAYTRNKRMGDGTTKVYPVIDHGLRVWLSTLKDQDYAKALLDCICAYKTSFVFEEKEYRLEDIIPDFFSTAMNLTPSEHLAMMSAVQPFIDSAISKTVNVPADSNFEDFKQIYDQAYGSKLKGVSTYRPNSILGSVLTVGVAEETPKVPVVSLLPDINPNTVMISKRPSGRLNSITDKVQYHGHNGNYTLYVSVSFMTIEGRKDGVDYNIERPVEVFINASPSSVPAEWVTTYSRTMSLIARSGLPLFTKALQDNRSIASGKHQIRYDWHHKADGSKVPRHHDSDVAVISYVIQNLLKDKGILDEHGNIATLKPFKTQSSISALIGDLTMITSTIETAVDNITLNIVPGSKCDECGALAVIKADGCSKCTACGHIGSCG